MKEIELKPCPFCGGEARTYDGNIDTFGVVCKKCGAKVYGYETRKKADNAWNRRVGGENS